VGFVDYPEGGRAFPQEGPNADGTELFRADVEQSLLAIAEGFQAFGPQFRRQGAVDVGGKVETFGFQVGDLIFHQPAT